MVSYPRYLFAISLLILWLAAQAGAFLRSRRPLMGDPHDDVAYSSSRSHFF